MGWDLGGGNGCREEVLLWWLGRKEGEFDKGDCMWGVVEGVELVREGRGFEGRGKVDDRNDGLDGIGGADEGEEELGLEWMRGRRKLE